MKRRRKNDGKEIVALPTENMQGTELGGYKKNIGYMIQLNKYKKAIPIKLVV